jgi:hypothetical protein
MNFVDSHEVALDVLGDSKDVWTCKWSGGDKVLVFRGDFINNRILYNHLLTLDCDPTMTVVAFCEWAQELLLALVKKEYKDEKQ